MKFRSVQSIMYDAAEVSREHGFRVTQVQDAATHHNFVLLHLSTCFFSPPFLASETYQRKISRNTTITLPSILPAPQAIYLAVGPYCTHIMFLYPIRPETIFLRLLMVYLETCGFKKGSIRCLKQDEIGYCEVQKKGS
jgi:hypothetical protein